MSSNFYLEGTPDEVKNAKGLHLVTMSTPNGKKVQIMLEELKAAYGTECNECHLESSKDWFLKLNPNGRIPILIDNTKTPPFPVMETSAELLYLLKEFDSKDMFGFKDELERNECLQWLFFWHGSGAPREESRLVAIRQIYAQHLTNAGGYIEALERFKNETLRVFGVLEIRLSGKYTGEPREYLAGNGKGKYSVADIGTWHNLHEALEDMNAFPHVLKWIDRIAERPAVQSGTAKRWQNW
ncbi:hypothetical protein BPOR_0165g00080 [Botrytis porri]|uniref:GST N-terminal domain-containing protein n=1 Tax=Botrytis porri TaxID=87229 RepID=A0A4Z1KVA6_9HELO|nr:hypothetical protein BPOR_0165g00080 [Botrytis porri]